MNRKSFLTAVLQGLVEGTIILGIGPAVYWAVMRTHAPTWAAVLAQVWVTLTMAVLILDIVPAIGTLAKGMQALVTIELRALRMGEDDDEGAPDDPARLASGQVHRRPRPSMGFKPTAPPPASPPPVCRNCQGRGSCDDPSQPCPVCRGTGRKPTLWHV